MDSVVRASIVRNEIAQVIKSDRLSHLGSSETQIFKLVPGDWVDLTAEPVIVHLIRDDLEGVTKMLAVKDHTLIINNVPVSSNFNVLTSSKKFFQFICNKFDMNSDTYGFGFATYDDMHSFLGILDKIKHAAMASLTLSFHQNTGLSTAARNILHGVAQEIVVPFGYDASPMKTPFQDIHPYETVDPNRDDSNSYKNTEKICSSSSAGIVENEEYTKTNQVLIESGGWYEPLSSGLPTEPALPLDPLPIFAERRLCDLLSSFEVPSLPSRATLLLTSIPLTTRPERSQLLSKRKTDYFIL